MSNRFILNLIGAHKVEYLSVFIFTAAINILMLSPSWYMLEVYDRVLSSKDMNTLLGLSLVVVFLYVVYGFLERYRGLILLNVSDALDTEIISLIYQDTLETRRSFLPPQTTISDLNNIKQFLTGQPIFAFLDAPWFLIYLLTIYLLHPVLGLIALISILILIVLATINQLSCASKLDEAKKCMVNEHALIQDAIRGVESISAMGMKKNIIVKLKTLREEYLNNLQTASFRSVNLSALSKFLRTAIQSVTLGYGAYLAVHNQISAGMIVAGSILLGRALSPIEGIINSWKQFQEFKNSCMCLSELTSRNVTERTISLGRPKGNIVLRNVELSLRGHGKPTLSQVTFEVTRGDFLVIIGPSGSGKTSLLKVMAGIYTPDQGDVLIDGADLKHRDMDELGKYIGYLGQTTELLMGKISSNIARFGEIDNQKVLEASILGDAHHMILSLPEGYETDLGSGGLGLSEGQKRKIGLARAFFDNPNLIFLDEPGNGLDEPSLKNLLITLDKLKQDNKTIVLTTHLPQFIPLADKVILIVDGSIKKIGRKADFFNAPSQEEIK